MLVGSELCVLLVTGALFRWVRPVYAVFLCNECSGAAELSRSNQGLGSNASAPDIHNRVDGGAVSVCNDSRLAAK